MGAEYAKKVECLLGTFELPPTETTLFEHLVDSELERRGVDPKTLEKLQTAR